MKNKILVLCLVSLMISLVLISVASAFSFREFFDKITGNAAFPINKNNCTDSDGGLNYNVLGNVTMCNRLSCRTYTDSCSGNSKNIIERYCSKTNMATKVYKCPAGCKNGACVVNQTCTDSDGGKNYYVQGVVSGYDSNGTYWINVSDICEGNNNLRERFCNGIYGEDIFYTCLNNCSNGACINASN